MKNNEKVSMKELHPIIAECIRDGGQFIFYPSGTSMNPTILQGEDSVVLTEAENLQKHDLVLFIRDNGKYVLHRIIGTNAGEYIIRGDNQAWTEKIRHDQIIAKVSQIRKKNGKVMTFRQFSGRLALLRVRLRFLYRLTRTTLGNVIKGR